MPVQLGLLGKGMERGTLTSEEVREIVHDAVAEIEVRGKRVLTIIPDGTRTIPMPLMFERLQHEMKQQGAAKSDYLVALGTHRAMSEEHLSTHMGQAVRDGRCGQATVVNHRWDTPETFAEVGVIPRAEVERLSNGLLHDEIPVRVNRLIFDYDQILICGPVFPHEVVGFSGGNKYLFPGISGREMIDFTHWLGALLGSYDIIGTTETPVRAMIDRAASFISVQVACLALVMVPEGIAGLCFGSAQEAWRAAAEVSAARHIVEVETPLRRVLSVMPAMYEDIWTAAKGMYKVEPAVADGGEVVIYAPHITEFSYVHGGWIEQIGYHCRDYFLASWEKFAEVPRGVLAHSTHLKGKGAYDPASGRETPRISVTLATGISAARCAAANLGYLDPASVMFSEWYGRESDGIKVIPKAGETLYRLSAPAVASS
jgi:nickel-dependent lactate racemase